MKTTQELVSLTQKCRKILGVGRNYLAHAKELSNPVPSSPIIFLKPPSAFLLAPPLGAEKVRFPPDVEVVHHEVELGVWIGDTVRCLSPAQVRSKLLGFSLCQDLTARDLQHAAKKEGLPWTLAKGFDTALPIGGFTPTNQATGWEEHGFTVWCKVNGELKQKCSTKHMIFPVLDLISWLSYRITLEKGDLLLTGTPAGVGPVSSGQCITSGLELDGPSQRSLATFTVEIA
eukprot:gb/GEZN01015349.1/.p1 GENE.gb/GEZN01015349.1/~~gb/GEZN01015349.1/.p1  ORF type:complete len:231 (+),score=32.20 gb/GEZN01015349.1/:56-748(+)